MNRNNEERLHTSILVGPEGERRKHRKARRDAAASLQAEERRARAAEAKARADAEREERRNTRYLPAAGEPGPAALRTPGRFRLPRHQDTSAALAGAYPFLAEGGLGSDGVFVGQDLYSGGSFVYDPWVLYQRGLITAPNVVLAGIVGSGKSSLAKSLYTRSIPFGRRVYVPGDPKGEHTPVAEMVGGQAIVLGHGLRNRLNPLDEGHRPSGLTDHEWTTQVASRRRDLIGALAATVLERSLTPLEHTAIDVALTAVVAGNDVPILPMVVDLILTPDPADNEDGRLAEDGRMVGHALRRLVAGDLQGLFDGPSTVQFDPSLPMISLDLSRVAENSTLISVLMTCSSAWMESALMDPNGGQRWVIYDEAWRLMSHPALLKRMDAQWRLARHYGIANMLIFHKLTDLDNVGDHGSAMRALASSLLANAETRIIYRQESDQLGVTAQTLGLTGTEQKLLPGLGTGQGLWRIKDRSFVIQHQLHPAELDAFDTTTRMITKNDRLTDGDESSASLNSSTDGSETS
ncbi:ATP-binding protein [Micrococcaceae sp. AOP34-BR2-30]